MSEQDKFDAWLMTRKEYGYDLALSAWLDSRAVTLEECAKAVEAEMLDDPTDSADDIAYDNAVADCVCAIRSLKD